MITSEQLTQLGIDQKWLQPLNDTFDKFEINTPVRMASFIGQCMHESGNFNHLEENLNYSAVRLTQVFPNRFTLAKQKNVLPKENKALLKVCMDIDQILVIHKMGMEHLFLEGV